MADVSLFDMNHMLFVMLVDEDGRVSMAGKLSKRGVAMLLEAFAEAYHKEADQAGEPRIPDEEAQDPNLRKLGLSTRPFGPTIGGEG